MKHTTFENELRDIRRRAINELKDAIKAHGGKIEHPVGPYKRTFEVNENNEIVARFFGCHTESELDIKEFHVEDILAITEKIPETDDVKDVSGVYPVPVTWVDRDDIENEGFDTSEVTQEKLNRIAEIMQDYSFLSIQHDIRTSDLYAACTKVCLKQKWD